MKFFRCRGFQVLLTRDFHHDYSTFKFIFLDYIHNRDPSITYLVTKVVIQLHTTKVIWTPTWIQERHDLMSYRFVIRRSVIWYLIWVTDRSVIDLTYWPVRLDPVNDPVIDRSMTTLVTVTWTGRHRTLVVAKCSQREHEVEIPFYNIRYSHTIHRNVF